MTHRFEIGIVLNYELGLYKTIIVSVIHNYREWLRYIWLFLTTFLKQQKGYYVHKKYGNISFLNGCYDKKEILCTNSTSTFLCTKTKQKQKMTLISAMILI